MCHHMCLRLCMCSLHAVSSYPLCMFVPPKSRLGVTRQLLRSQKQGTSVDLFTIFLKHGHISKRKAEGEERERKYKLGINPLAEYQQ